jgi:hypothetical protein
VLKIADILVSTRWYIPRDSGNKCGGGSNALIVAVIVVSIVLACVTARCVYMKYGSKKEVWVDSISPATTVTTTTTSANYKPVCAAEPIATPVSSNVVNLRGGPPMPMVTLVAVEMQSVHSDPSLPVGPSAPPMIGRSLVSINVAAAKLR